MFDVITQAVSELLAIMGFETLGYDSSPKSAEYADKFIAFISPVSAGAVQTGFTFDVCAKMRVFEYTVKCRLLGTQGDCSDRAALINAACSFQTAALSQGYEVTLTNKECELELKKSYIINSL